MLEQESVFKKKFNGAWVYFTLQLITFIPLQFFLVLGLGLTDQPSIFSNSTAFFFSLSILISIGILILWFIKPKVAYWLHVILLIMLIIASVLGELLGASPVLLVILIITLVLENKILITIPENTTNQIK